MVIHKFSQQLSYITNYKYGEKVIISGLRPVIKTEEKCTTEVSITNFTQVYTSSVERAIFRNMRSGT